MPTIPRAFSTNDRDDRERASNGQSRFGAYLFQHGHRFFSEEGTPTADVVEFAFAAWDIANSPMMAPGYVRTHPRVTGTEPCWDDDARPALTAYLAASWPGRVADMLGPNVDSWVRQYSGDHVIAWHEPWGNERLSVFTTLAVRVPVQVDLLPTPRYRAGTPDTTTAKHAVNVLCATLNTVASPMVLALDDPQDDQ